MGPCHTYWMSFSIPGLAFHDLVYCGHKYIFKLNLPVEAILCSQMARRPTEFKLFSSVIWGFHTIGPWGEVQLVHKGPLTKFGNRFSVIDNDRGLLRKSTTKF
uniref:Uncharacterized protein n=1 Tax=Strigamia maritima TaxID=126957 RepID=T1JIH5_STRMM